MRQMFSIDSVHADMVMDCQFTKDGKYIVTAGRDHCIKITDFSTRKEVVTLESGQMLLP